MKQRSVVGVVALLAAVAAAVGFMFPFWRHPQTLRLPGVVEIQDVRLGSKIGGRVENTYVLEGSLVEAGTLLVRFEAPELEAQLLQTQAKLNQSRAELERYKNGARLEEKQEADSELKSTETDLRLAEEEMARVEKVYRQGASTQAEYDTARANRNRAFAKRNSARARRDLIYAGTRYEMIEESKARVAEYEGRVEELKANLREAEVRAPSRAVIEVLSVRKGDLVAPNQPVVRMLKADDLWVRVYVPETQLGKVRLHQEADVTVDSYPGRRFKGEVIQIDAMSEFTPRNVQSIDERRFQVFGVKVRVAQPEDPGLQVFKSGMAAEVILPLED
jgi:multidrug resistance efflux pump